MSTNVYVDGFNLYYGCLRERPGKWLDLERLFAQLLPDHDVKRIRYFTVRVSDRITHPGVAGRQHTYLRALKTLPTVQVHLGHFMIKESSATTRTSASRCGSSGTSRAKRSVC